LKSFEGTGIPTTISAAIEFAHVKMPLGKVLGDSHHLLDDIAKEGAGRDALAVRVWKQSGMALEWAQPWEIVIQNGEIQIDKIAKDFVKNDEALGNGNFSNKFFFKIRERFDLLNPDKEEILNQEKAVEKSIREANSYLNEKEINEAIKKAIKEAIDKSINEAIELLAVDYVNSADNREKVSIQQARSIIKPLLEQCRAVKRSLDEPDSNKWERSHVLKADAALLVRFLIQKGVER
jgi:CRISPR-associated protein Cmr2